MILSSFHWMLNPGTQPKIIYLPRKVTDSIFAVWAPIGPWDPIALTAPLTPIVPGSVAFRNTPAPAVCKLHVDAC